MTDFHTNYTKFEIGKPSSIFITPVKLLFDQCLRLLSIIGSPELVA